MKKNLFAIAIAAVFTLTGCGKEETSNENGGSATGSEVPATIDILHTTWQGVFNGTVEHPQAGTLPCILTWTLDFIDESNVSIMLEMSINGQAQQPQDLDCTYTYDGLHGELISEEDGVVQRDAFDVDPVNRTFTIDLRITTGFSQEEPQVVGGPTVFHQIH